MSEVMREALEFQSTCLREARHSRRDNGRWILYFNPRAYVRHDYQPPPLGRVIQFQSTCLREARPRPDRNGGLRLHFNPRAYVRHDGRLQLAAPGLEISIHVPT